MQYTGREELEKQFWEGLVEYFDEDKDGTINREEFTSMIVGIHSDYDVLGDNSEDAVVRP